MVAGKRLGLKQLTTFKDSTTRRTECELAHFSLLVPGEGFQCVENKFLTLVLLS